ncbi:uncharacterized protein LOC129716889 [Wyeomyia smithii]|uniref:uncharacterized protein LOC129716889 n=1 Tax=Wyeomyia smithii TaxID=174621 RepID=UPI002467EE75|nr:uncharacterized protein LOC129716889 [Wyeomyia smithii]
MNNSAKGQCALLAGKARVAPVKPMSVLRLELKGCVIGARLAKHVQEHHRIRIDRRFYWTDSTTALSWIRADPRNYRPYVAHRIGEILEVSSVAEWRWVPSKLNPADEATKWGKGPYFSDESKWFAGPTFLQLPEEEWPHPVEATVATTEEVRMTVLLHTTKKFTVFCERFSHWESLLGVMRCVLRFINNIRRGRTRFAKQLKQNELRAARDAVFNQVQYEIYTEEMMVLAKIDTLPSNHPGTINKDSSLYQFMLVIDDNGVIRQGSRARKAEHLPFDTRYPILLPRDHPATRLLIDYYHRIYRHANPETVVNEMRQLYMIPSLRTMVKLVSRTSQFCKLRRAKPQIPPMAPLPSARLAHHVRPFSYVGIDYFGPVLVEVGRSNVKRWIALFTCLTVRAVHLEIAYSLSTASCVSCVRRFVSRRECPVEFYSDNGTNFQGADRILREQINQGLSATFTNAETKCNFNPPEAPHMGGAWERLVRSVKAAMGEAYSDGKLDDEGLQTLVVEAESLVNSRPLTYLPLDSEESEALTPNHFLLGSSGGVKQPVSVIDSAKPQFLKASWEQIQKQLTVFWKRWLDEYLPVIRRQPKWFDESRPLREGDLVLIVDERKRSWWTRGRIVEVMPDGEGRVRQALVQTTSGLIRRPTTKLALLDVGEGAVLANSKMHRVEDVGDKTA